jgi:hypothetical protein
MGWKVWVKYLEIVSEPKYEICDHLRLVFISQAIMTISDHKLNIFCSCYKRKSCGTIKKNMRKRRGKRETINNPQENKNSPPKKDINVRC